MGQTIAPFGSVDVIEEDHKSGLGPRGIGDPDDMTLRSKEILVHIPRYQKKAAEYKCQNLSDEYEECLKKHTLPFSCRDKFAEYVECVHHWSFDIEYREQITQEYLNIRQEYRKTGRRRLGRAFN